MHRFAIPLCTLLCFGPVGCDTGPGDGKPTEGTADHSAIMAKLVGTWVAEGESAETYEISATRFKATYPKIEGGKPMEGALGIVSVEGNTVTVSQTLELGNGKTFPGDNQIITIIDDDTIERRNAKNNSGGTFKRKR